MLDSVHDTMLARPLTDDDRVYCYDAATGDFAILGTGYTNWDEAAADAQQETNGIVDVVLGVIIPDDAHPADDYGTSGAVYNFNTGEYQSPGLDARSGVLYEHVLTEYDTCNTVLPLAEAISLDGILAPGE